MVREQGGQTLERGGLGGVGLGSVGGAKVGEDFGVEPIGLGEQPAGAGEVADLARIEDADGQAVAVERGDQGVLVAAGGLAEDLDAGLERLESGGEGGQAGGVIGDGEGLVEEAAVDGGFGDIGTEIDTHWVHR